MALVNGKFLSIKEEKGGTTIESFGFQPQAVSAKQIKKVIAQNEELSKSHFEIKKLKAQIKEVTEFINNSKSGKLKQSLKNKLAQELERNKEIESRMNGYNEACNDAGLDVKKAVNNYVEDKIKNKKPIVNSCKSYEYYPGDIK